MEKQRRLGLRDELAALGALVIRVEDEPVLVEILQQHHADIGQAVRVDGGERHGVRIVRLALLGLEKPGSEEAEGIASFREVTHS